MKGGYFMGEEGWAQCQSCGRLHKVKLSTLSNEDLFVQEFCPKCRDETKHLWIGSQDDIYIAYNLNVDPRYYTYNTK
jgi:Zn finger protein HypA/HybF involved in hydrogenase expression